MPSSIGRVLSLVRRLIDYGRQLAATVRHAADTPALARLAVPFGSADVSIILRRILNGLRRAAALEARLAQRAARGQDLAVWAVRVSTPRGPRLPRQDVAPDAQPPETQPAVQAEDPRLARLPTEDEIAAEVRRRPVGAVIADICHDLGITPGRIDRAFWDEISQAIMCHGGSIVRFTMTMVGRIFSPVQHADPAGPEAPQPLPALATTGPP